MPRKKPTYEELENRIKGLEKIDAERKRAEESLRESEELFRTLSDSSPIGIFQTDRDGRVLYLNDQWCSITGMSKQDALGFGWSAALYAGDRQWVLEEWKNRLRENKGYDGEFRFTRPSGETRWVHTITSPIRSAAGDIIGYVGANEDITERKRSEEALRESEERYRLLTHNIPVGLYRNTPGPKGRFIMANQAIAKMFGFDTVEEFMKWSVASLYQNPVDREVFSKKLLSQGRVVGEHLRLKKRDGTPIWGAVTVQVVHDESGSIIHFDGMIEEITERKQAEEAFRQSEAIIHRVFGAVPVGICIMKDRVYQSANKNWCESFGYPEESILGKTTRILYESDEEYQRVGRELYNQLLEKGLTTVETKLRRSDGVLRDVVLIAAPLQSDDLEAGIVIVIRDVTDSKQAKEALQRSKALLRKVLDTVPSYICAKDINGRFLLVNKALASFYGSTVDEMTGLLHADICEDEEELQTMLAADREVIESGKPKIIPEESMKNPDGSVTYLETIKIPFAVFGDPAVLIMARDITERKQLEEELSKSDKLESIGILAGGVAHDFNNILTVILGNISLANIIADEDIEKAKKILSEAEKATLSAKDLTQQLLTFAKGGEPVKKTIRISSLILDTVRFALRGSNVNYDFQLEDFLWSVDVDKGQFKQVINNLVINADQAMPEGGTISVNTRNAVISSKDALPLEDGKYVKITIKDQGHGIPEDHKLKIFDPYFTTKQKGSGLGLATCYSILKKHNGHIAVESEQNVGTTFTIYLPASSELVDVKEEKKTDVSKINGKILVMDDESVLLDVVSKVLQHIGCDTEGATDGTDAVKLYRKAMKSGKPFDAVILDLTIPGGMGGKETIKRLLKIDPDVKAIVSSGYSNNPVLANFQDYGFISLVTKPYRIDQLREVLQSVLQEKSG
jgi:PAS domain S-box-containing protein